MGRAPRPEPSRLAGKLARIRNASGLSQNEMLSRLGLSDTEGMFRSSISGYERGTREPPLPVLLEYARATNVYIDALVNNDVDLPENLACLRKSEGVSRKLKSKTKLR